MSAEQLVISQTLPPSAEDISAGYLSHPAAEFQSFRVFDVSGDEPEYKQAAAQRDQQLEDFTNGKIRNPILNNCPDFQAGRTERRNMYRQAMSLFHARQMRREAGAQPTLEDDMVDAVVARKINELGFVETSALIAENQLSYDERHEAAQVLREAGQEIYGLPDRDTALTFLQKRLDDVEKLMGHDAQLQAIADYVKERISLPSDYETKDGASLDQATIDHYEHIIADECREDVEAAFEVAGDKDVYTPDDMQQIFAAYLERRGFSDAGWQAKVIEGRTMCASVAADKTVEIGADRAKSMRSRDHVLKSMLHEIEVHVGRNVRGHRLGSGLAGSGLAGYVMFEEPFANSVQNLYTNDIKQTGELPVVAIALSAGMDGVPRDYRDTFELLWRMSLASEYDADKPLDDQITKAQKSANAILVRIWRGMPTDVPGCVFTKDRSYENSAVTAYLHNDGAPLPRADFMRLLSAKYDPRDPKQDAYVRQFI